VLLDSTEEVIVIVAIPDLVESSIEVAFTETLLEVGIVDGAV